MDAEPQWKRRTDPESRRPVAVAALVIIGGEAWVARGLGLDQFWLLPAISTVLLAASIAVYGARASRVAASVLSHALNVVLVLATAVSLVLLGGPRQFPHAAQPALRGARSLGRQPRRLRTPLLGTRRRGSGSRAAGYVGRFPTSSSRSSRPTRAPSPPPTGSRPSTTTSTCR